MPLELDDIYRYIKFQEKFGARVGDSVKIIYKPKYEHEKGWKNAWMSEMDTALGQVGVVTSINGKSGINIKVPGISYDFGYPYYSLEIIR